MFTSNIFKDTVKKTVEAAVKNEVEEAKKSPSKMKALVQWVAEWVILTVLGKENVGNWRKKVYVLLGVLGFMTALALIDIFAGGSVSSHGVHPREMAGLVGILLGPFLHAGIWHLIVNVLPFFVLGGLVMMRPNGIKIFGILTAVDTIVGGLVIWSTGQVGSNHIGCSGLIFCYFSYVLLYGVVAKEFRAAVLSIFVFLFYGGIFWSLFPSTDERYSWEAHMCGCVIGACMGAFDAHQNFAAQLPDSFFQKEKRSMSDGLSEKDEERRGLMAGDDDDDDDDLYSLDADDLVDDVYSLGDEDLGQV